MPKTTKEFLAELGNRVSIDDPTNSVVFSNNVSFPNKVGLGNNSVLGQMSISTGNSSIAGGLFGGIDGSTPYVAFGIGNGPTIVAKYSGTGYNFTLPPNKGSSGQVLSTDGNGATSWINSGGGGGSVNTDAQYTWTNNHFFTKGVSFGNTTVAAELSLSDGTGIYGGIFAGRGPNPYVAFGIPNGPTLVATASGAAYNFNLPPNKGSAGQILSTDGNGATSWIPAGSASVNTASQYTWTNTHTFTGTANVNIVATGTNQQSILRMNSSNASAAVLISAGFNGVPDANNYGSFAIQPDRTFAFYSTNANGAPRPIWSVRTNADASVPPDKEAQGLVTDKLGCGLFIDAPVVLRNGIVPYGSGTRGNDGQILASTGNTFPGIKWIDAGGVSVNTAAQYTWTNSHTFIQRVDLGNNSVLGQMSISTGNSTIAGGLFGGIDGSTPYVAFGIGNGPTIVSRYTGTGYNFTLPPNKGSAGQVLSTDGNGITSWINAGGGGTAPGNKGPITVTNDSTWSLNTSVVTDSNLSGSISASKLAGNITPSLLSAGAPTWTTGSNLTCSGGLNTAAINYNGFITSGGTFNVFSVNNNQVVGYIRDTGFTIQKPGGATMFSVNSGTGDVVFSSTTGTPTSYLNLQGDGATGTTQLWRASGTWANWTAKNDTGAFLTQGPVNVVVDPALIANEAVKTTDIMSKVRNLNAIYLDHVGTRSMAVGVDALKAHFPELVADLTYESEKEGTIKHDTVDLLGLISVLLESVKNLDARIQELEPKNTKK